MSAWLAIGRDNINKKGRFAILGSVLESVTAVKGAESGVDRYKRLPFGVSTSERVQKWE